MCFRPEGAPDRSLPVRRRWPFRLCSHRGAAFVALALGILCGGCASSCSAPPVPRAALTPDPEAASRRPDASEEEASEAGADEGDHTPRERTVKRLYRQTRGPVPYRPPTPSQTEALVALAQDLLEAAVDNRDDLSALEARASAVGLELTPFTDAGERFLALTEPASDRRGWGAYLFRTGPAADIILQAPHTFYDEGTGPIAVGLFRDFPLRAFYFNTIHRGKGRDGDDGESVLPTDVAHNSDHPFHRLTEGLGVRPGLCVVQLHGFGERTGLDAALIVSAGRKTARDQRVIDAIDRLKSQFPGVRRFPDEIDVLGGLTNVQAMAVNLWAGGAFLHVELSSAMRTSLADRAALRTFGEALLGLPPRSGSAPDAARSP